MGRKCIVCKKPETVNSVVNVGPDSIITDDNDIYDSAMVEHEHSYFESLQRLSSFVENTSEYIAGFIVKKTLKKLLVIFAYNV